MYFCLRRRTVSAPLPFFKFDLFSKGIDKTKKRNILYLTFRLNVNRPRGGDRWLALQKMFKALADPTRREILNLLKNGRMSAGEITEHFNVSFAAVSRHLSVLKEANLIRDKREGKFIFYEINLSVLEEVFLWLKGLEGNHEKD